LIHQHSAEQVVYFLHFLVVSDMCISLQGANVICGTKRQHSGNVESGSDRYKQARIENNAEDMDLDESGTLCFTVCEVSC